MQYITVSTNPLAKIFKINTIELVTAGHEISLPMVSEEEADVIEHQALNRLRGETTMYDPQKLHPISYVTSLINVIKNNFIVIIIFLFNIKDFKYDDFYSYLWPGIMTLIFLITFFYNIFKVYNTRYWIENNHFILTTGVLNKERKELNISRIQSVDTTEGFVNQIVGGVELIIKTPSDGIELSTISKSKIN